MDCPTQIIYEKQNPLLVIHSAIIRVIDGLNTGMTCPLELKRIQVGTASDNQLILSDPKVSRHHLEFRVQDQGYLLLDLGSTNGTYLGGARIHEALINVGAEIRLGATVLRIEEGRASVLPITQQESFGSLIGSSQPMLEVYGILRTVAKSDTTVLIEGETGTGKEVVAEELHRQSSRRDHSFNVVDCGALPPNLIESELFGHEKGAFTGAVSAHEGIFERSRGGTVFLDEIGELPLDMQTRLLRVLDKRMVRRVGGDIMRKVDVRVIAATNRNLADEVAQCRFRQDLFYRLAVVRVVIPPLRNRKEDLPLLARHFLLQAGCPDPSQVLTKEVLQALMSRRWPGNVRELRNVIERAVVLSDGSNIPLTNVKSVLESEREAKLEDNAKSDRASKDFRTKDVRWLGHVLPSGFLDQPYKDAKNGLIQQFEELYVRRLHQRHGNNISHIADHAKIDRHLARKLLRKYGLHDNE